jgi:hypothetical protein
MMTYEEFRDHNRKKFHRGAMVALAPQERRRWRRPAVSQSSG